MQTIKYAILRAGGSEGMYNIAIYAINNQLITSSIYLNPTSSNDQASTIKRIASDSAYALKLPLLTQTLDLEDIKLAQQKIYGSASPSDYDTWDSIERYPNDLLNCADCINNWSGDITAAIDESSSRYCPPDEDEAPLLNTHKRDATLGDLSTAEIIHYLESQGDMYLHYWHQDDLEERLIADGFHPGEENFAVFKSELEAWLGSAEHFQSFAINHIFNCHQPLWQF